MITIRTTERNGKVVGVAQVVDDDQVMLITDGGKVLRSPVSGHLDDGPCDPRRPGDEPRDRGRSSYRWRGSQTSDVSDSSDAES